ncbi:hypothetical protein BV25DRAFT_1830068 [Artomyces pyxidatus]|uniref:Uncharacterized protein n=1 Tax=Artomyces pyxidatus TaxID=48021 RepID=A0ACB8SPC4_9AGAM|nr:hypothetical protein BV25DRAFT_1830068 [Artomyces pyxidatus]
MLEVEDHLERPRNETFNPIIPPPPSLTSGRPKETLLIGPAISITDGTDQRAIDLQYRLASEVYRRQRRRDIEDQELTRVSSLLDNALRVDTRTLTEETDWYQLEGMLDLIGGSLRVETGQSQMEQDSKRILLTVATTLHAEGDVSPLTKERKLAELEQHLEAVYKMEVVKGTRSEMWEKYQSSDGDSDGDEEEEDEGV